MQDFLRKLSGLLPGCRAELPTEAEWEYACRAGTDTPFSFGENITPEQVNYDGTYPYAGGEKGVYREETVPVKSLPPNAWGLYEMHGNVWEWCADGRRDYDANAQVDPVGPVDQESHRVVRGGSWYIGAGRSRSACRGAGHPGFAFDYLGFRFSLRSLEPGPARGGPEGPPGVMTKPAMKMGIENFSLSASDVFAERIRQIIEEGWSKHDDAHQDCELARAAACYAICTQELLCVSANGVKVWPPGWQFNDEGYRRNLVKAAALLIAEIERIDRRDQKCQGQS